MHRVHRVLPLAVAFAVLLSGCSADPAPAAAPAGPVGEPLSSGDAPLNATQDLLLFETASQEQGLAQDGVFAVGDSCMPFGGAVPCSGERVFDLTPIVPADVPVQVSVAVDDDAGPGVFIDVYLRFEQAAATTYLESEDDGALVAVVVMQAGGRVEAVVTQFFPSLLPPAEVNFHLEARTVVRPDVVPSFVPVAVDLEPGQTLLAAGDDLEDLVVIPPGGTALHHLGPYVYNATSSGRHVVIASGQGDTRLYGPPGTTLQALLVQLHQGEPHPVPSGEEVAWSFTLEGIPLYVGLLVETADQAQGFAVAPFHGNHELTMTHAGFDVLQASETGCAVSCGFSLVGSGTTDHAVSDYLDEHIGPGAYEVTARFETANGMQLREFAAYVLP
jgi:hypothetical protein